MLLISSVMWIKPECKTKNIDQKESIIIDLESDKENYFEVIWFFVKYYISDFSNYILSFTNFVKEIFTEFKK